METKGNIAKAVAEVMGKIEKLQKTEKNIHGNYDFVSVDDFLEMVRPLCAKATLYIDQQEDEVEFLSTTGTDRNGKEKKSNWAKIKHSFTLHHSSGESSAPTYRTIMVLTSMGPQAFGAAQSYNLKNYLRSLFMMGTGDIDVDDTGALDEMAGFDRPGDGIRGAMRQAARGDAPQPTPPMWKGPLDKATLEQKADNLVDDVLAVDDSAGMSGLERGYKDVISQLIADMPKKWREVSAEINKRWEYINKREA